MTVTEYYLKYVSEICEGSRPTPAGIVLHETDDLRKALELQAAIQKMGICEFVKACAKEEGTEIPQEVFDSFRPEDLDAAVAAMAKGQDAPAEEKEPVQTETREIYEVFLESVQLEDSLVQYLADILKRRDKGEFEVLSRAAARTVLDMEDFLCWLGNKECFAPAEEKACAEIMDACLSRLQSEGELELLAALLSGDEKTFKLFRTQAPELVHLPAATYEWYCENYLDKFYPIRFLLRFRGVEFPKK